MSDIQTMLSNHAGEDIIDVPNQLNPDDEHRIVRKITWRLLPYMMCLYLIAYLDRTNIASARATMVVTLGMDDVQYLNAVGWYYCAYCLFGLPSQLLMLKWRPSVWICCIMIGWGIITTLQARCIVALFCFMCWLPSFVSCALFCFMWWCGSFPT